MKYSQNDAGHQAEFKRRTKNCLPESRRGTYLPVRVPGLRYRNSLRQSGLRAPLPEIYAETRLDASDPCLPFRLNSFSTHSTKNS